MNRSPLSPRRWFRALTSRFFPSTPRNQRLTPFRPAIEGLEERVLLSASVTLNALNNSTTALISYNDGAGDSRSVYAYVSQFNVTETNGGAAPINFNTFCIDLLHDVSVGQTYAVDVRNDLAVPPPTGGFVNGAQMAYIYAQWGMQDLSSNPDQAAAVQIALWDLSLNNHTPTSFGWDSSVNAYDSGDPSVFSVANVSADGDAIAGLVNTYLTAAAGATTQGNWLDASASGDDLDRGQSLMMIPAPVVTGTTFSATESTAASGLVASFTTADPGLQASSFQATIDWGDGTPDTAGVITANNSGGFDVTGTHLYTEENTDTITVTGGVIGSATAAAQVVDAPLTGSTGSLFGPATTVAAGNTPDSIGTLQLDNGNTVILVANFNGGNVSLTETDGSSYTSLGTLATGAGPNGFAVGDFGNGEQDFATADYGSDELTTYLGDGTGNFSQGQTLATGSGPANELAIGDFYGTGTLDIASANMNDGTVSIFEGNGDGTFQSAQSVFVGQGIDAIVAGDFNGDGSTELAVANYNAGTVTILTPQTDGSWSVGTPIAVGANPWYITAGDFTGTGNADIATAGFGSGVSVLLNNGDGTFQSP
jgi:hypothetical protein